VKERRGIHAVPEGVAAEADGDVVRVVRRRRARLRRGRGRLGRSIRLPRAGKRFEETDQVLRLRAGNALARNERLDHLCQVIAGAKEKRQKRGLAFRVELDRDLARADLVEERLEDVREGNDLVEPEHPPEPLIAGCGRSG
jgi:hypothetical protein